MFLATRAATLHSSKHHVPLGPCWSDTYRCGPSVTFGRNRACLTTWTCGESPFCCARRRPDERNDCWDVHLLETWKTTVSHEWKPNGTSWRLNAFVRPKTPLSTRTCKSMSKSIRRTSFTKQRRTSTTGSMLWFYFSRCSPFTYPCAKWNFCYTLAGSWGVTPPNATLSH